MEDVFKTLPWPKNSPEDRGSEVLQQETRPWATNCRKY